RMSSRRQLLQGELLLAGPGGDDGEIDKHSASIHGISFHREKLDRAPAFAQCLFFASESGVNQAQHAERRTIIRLRLYDLLLLDASFRKSDLCSRFIFQKARKQAFPKTAAKLNGVVVPTSIIP